MLVGTCQTAQHLFGACALRKHFFPPPPDVSVGDRHAHLLRAVDTQAVAIDSAPVTHTSMRASFDGMP
eukprot:scaffold10029_cov52-Phaeocystis_antarctica.AAC.1